VSKTSGSSASTSIDCSANRAAAAPGPGRPAVLAAVITVSAAVAPASALAEASYPSALDATTLSLWLRQATDLSPEQVVGISPSAAIAIVSRTQPDGGPLQLLLRAQVLTPEAAARTGRVAWQMPLDVDCRNGEIRTGALTGFAVRRSEEGQMVVAPADPDWRQPPAGTVLERAWRAACDPKFQPPLAASAPSAPRALAMTAKVRPQPRPGASPPTTQSAARTPQKAIAQAPAGTPPERRGHGAVQVVSSPVEADTRRWLAALRSRSSAQLANLETRIEPAQVRGRTVYRGVVTGFASRSAAEAFCQALKTRGQDCLARS
jgi:hypothetical protein